MIADANMNTIWTCSIWPQAFNTSGSKLNIENCSAALVCVSEEILMLQGRMLEIHLQPTPSACLVG
jgi:hypothetical protein